MLAELERRTLAWKELKIDYDLLVRNLPGPAPVSVAHEESVPVSPLQKGYLSPISEVDENGLGSAPVSPSSLASSYSQGEDQLVASPGGSGTDETADAMSVAELKRSLLRNMMLQQKYETQTKTVSLLQHQLAETEARFLQTVATLQDPATIAPTASDDVTGNAAQPVVSQLLAATHAREAECVTLRAALDEKEHDRFRAQNEAATLRVELVAATSRAERLQLAMTKLASERDQLRKEWQRAQTAAAAVASSMGLNLDAVPLASAADNEDLPSASIAVTPVKSPIPVGGRRPKALSVASGAPLFGPPASAGTPSPQLSKQAGAPAADILYAGMPVVAERRGSVSVASAATNGTATPVPNKEESTARSVFMGSSPTDSVDASSSGAGNGVTNSDTSMSPPSLIRARSRAASISGALNALASPVRNWFFCFSFFFAFKSRRYSLYMRTDPFIIVIYRFLFYVVLFVNILRYALPQVAPLARLSSGGTNRRDDAPRDEEAVDEFAAAAVADSAVALSTASDRRGSVSTTGFSGIGSTASSTPGGSGSERRMSVGGGGVAGNANTSPGMYGGSTTVYGRNHAAVAAAATATVTGPHNTSASPGTSSTTTTTTSAAVAVPVGTGSGPGTGGSRRASLRAMVLPAVAARTLAAPVQKAGTSTGIASGGGATTTGAGAGSGEATAPDRVGLPPSK